jgi:hypothetical protein
MMSRSLASIAGLVLLSGCSVVGIRSGYDQPSYTVLDSIEETVEIRRYESRVAAETTVQAGSAEAGREQAFRRLFDYISGANQGQSKIAMTAPVEVDAEARKIAMTVPVETAAGDDGRYTMRFFLPSDYTSATAPEPTDRTVRIIELRENTVAVRRFSGSRAPEQLDRRTTELLSTLASSAWRPAGNPSSLFYDPPWTLPFLRRNEVAIPVKQTPEAARDG